MTLRTTGGSLLLALLLSGCAGGMIPPAATGPGSTGPRPPRSSPKEEVATRPQAATPRAPLPPAAPSVAAVDPASAAGIGLTKGPAIGDLIPSGERARLALRAFRISCPTLMRRTDASGLTQGSDWNTACAVAGSWPEPSAT